MKFFKEICQIGFGLLWGLAFGGVMIFLIFLPPGIAIQTRHAWWLLLYIPMAPIYGLVGKYAPPAHF